MMQKKCRILRFFVLSLFYDNKLLLFYSLIYCFKAYFILFLNMNLKFNLSNMFENNCFFPEQRLYDHASKVA